MSLFENLIDELKEENLLEETIIESSSSIERSNDSAKNQTFAANNDLSFEKTTNGNAVKNLADSFETADQAQENPYESVESRKLSAETYSPDNSTEPLVFSDEDINVFGDTSYQDDFAENEPDIDENFQTEKISKNQTEISSTPKESENNQIISDDYLNKTGKESASKIAGAKGFYRRKALDEVNSLEMTELVFSGVEREVIKISPQKFDDYQVKHTLHEFLQIADDVKSPNHAQSELNLMKETEEWFSILLKRDERISVANLRSFCENSKPSLSSQALMSLARFYRNSPYSESVRSKFDLIITRLFSKDLPENKRELVFPAQELITHIQELYADWSSVPLYSTDEEDSELLLMALKFQDFINEAENADSFDELIKKDFFKRLKNFKDKTNENFFSPLLAAAAIESNVAIGNRYIELIEMNRANPVGLSLTEKYGVIHDKSISEATSKTLELITILKQHKSEDNDSSLLTDMSANSDVIDEKTEKNKNESNKNNLFKANKWLIIATVATIIGAIIFQFFILPANKPDPAMEVSNNVKTVNLENSSLKEYVHSARINEDTLFAVVEPTWGKMSVSEKENVVETFIKAGQSKGFQKVHFLDSKGVTVAHGSKDKIEIVQ